MNSELAQSYAYCERVARWQAGNFYHGFRILPRPQRLAMCALYAFLRETDDISDGPESLEKKRTLLAAWRESFDAARSGHYVHRLFPALHHTVTAFGIPWHCLDQAIDGVEMDLGPVTYATFDDLYRYCYRVASVVGVACIHIWGFAREIARTYAEKAGIAFQLTNILRDLKEDAERGRIYLPEEDLKRHGYSADMLHRGERTERFRALMAFEIARARDYYDESLPLVELLPSPGRAVFLIMWRTYRGLLDAIEQHDYDVFRERIRLSFWRKMRFVVQALPVRWGWRVPKTMSYTPR